MEIKFYIRFPSSFSPLYRRFSLSFFSSAKPASSFSSTGQIGFGQGFWKLIQVTMVSGIPNQKEKRKKKRHASELDISSGLQTSGNFLSLSFLLFFLILGLLFLDFGYVCLHLDSSWNSWLLCSYFQIPLLEKYYLYSGLSFNFIFLI